MINKKGEHVDWIISIGIFLIYLLGMFVIIKPGIIPLHNYNTLLDIAEEHFREDVKWEKEIDSNTREEKLTEFGGLYWTLNKVPLFLSDTSGSVGNCIKIDFPYIINYDKINFYKFDLDENNQKILKPLRKKLSGKLYLAEEQGASFNTDTEYLIFFSDNQAYSKEFDNKNIFSEELITPPGESLDSICVDNIKDANINFNYNLGIVEKIRGISEVALGLLGDTNPDTYEEIKEIYTYPKSKEFSILITLGETTYNYKIREPGVKTNIYTRQWGDFILNYDGTRKHVQISVKVW